MSILAICCNKHQEIVLNKCLNIVLQKKWTIVFGSQLMQK